MPTDELIGAELGDYRPVRVLGRGGMGVVYEAEDLALRRTVALKVLAPNLLEDTTARGRFQREIEHAVAIEHPHVVPVYAAGFERPHFYLATRLIRGPDLARLLSTEGALEERRALRVLGQVASALHAMHERGMIHRDVKPANVLLWGAGQDDEHAMLTDFGIAKALNESHGVTGLGAVGTPAYMAPEVCLGRSALPASDQYSLACMAFELLAGRSPFDADGISFADAHIGQTPMSLATAAPRVSASVAAAVDRGLAKEPGERHRDVREFVRSASAANQAFESSQAITRVMAETTRPGDTVERLSRQHGLTDAAISQITEIDRTEIVRLRRRLARQALAGGGERAGDARQPTSDGFTPIRTLAQLQELQQAGTGFIAITDSADPTRLHRAGCPAIKDGYFETKVVHNLGRNGQYLAVASPELARGCWPRLSEHDCVH